MKNIKRRWLPGLLLSALLLGGCGRETVVLLPMPDGGPSAVVVTPKAGQEVLLEQPGNAVNVSGESAGSVYSLSESSIQKRYGQIIQTLPELPVHFRLYFESGTAEMVPESRSLLPKVLEAIKERQSTDVSVVGHADREGNRKWNYTVSKMRAEEISRQLIKMGVNPEFLEVTSHGEENPLIPTPDNVAEPRNRRVEVIVR
ncbi:MAG: OmpA family protein [Desulfovibrio sp.]